MDAAAVASRLRSAGLPQVETDHPLAPLTTFRIGGVAAVFVEPASADEVSTAARVLAGSEVEWLVLGKGSNVLIADTGFDGVVLHLGRGLRWSERDGTSVRAGAAMPLPALAGVAAAEGLTGLEFCIAIPGSLGGGVRMNAGAHGGTMSEVVTSATVVSLSDGSAREVPAAEAGFRYRGSTLAEMGVVVDATLSLAEGDRESIRSKMAEARAWRRRTQPLGEPNCGSVFRNPPGGYAARMIEDAGAKGLRIGGAVVSEKHANFIVAEPGATAADVVTLIEHVQHLVEDMFGVRLEREVQLVGDFGVGRP